MDREGKAARRRRFVEVERRGRRFEMGEKRARGGRKVAEGGVVGWWRVRKVASQGELSDSELEDDRVRWFLSTQARLILLL